MVKFETIGYGGKKPEKFYQELEELNPDIVVDVRKNPYNSFLGVYTKPKLAEKLGDKYTWIPELGNKTMTMPPTLMNEQTGLKKLLKLFEENEHVMLLCAEKDEERCRRSYIKDKIMEILKS